MSTFPILDLVIGLIFIFFLFSIATSSAVEMIITISRARAQILEVWLKKIFDKQALSETGQPLILDPLKQRLFKRVIAKNAKPALMTVGQAIMDHCLTTVRADKGKATPYMSANNFVSAMLDKITIQKAPAATNPNIPALFQPPPQNLQAYINAIQNTELISNELKRTFLAFAQEAVATATVANTHAGNVATNILGEIKTDMDIFRTKLEGWFNDTQDRFTDKLKRGWTVWLTAVCGAIIVVASNADTINIAKYLYGHKEFTQQFADSAIAQYKYYQVMMNRSLDTVRKQNRDTFNKLTVLQKAPSLSAAEKEKVKDGQEYILNKLDSATADFKAAMADIKNKLPSAIPMGWQTETYPERLWYARTWHACRFHFFGWLVTILAIMLGAPFWFDLLGKIANIRGTGPKPATDNKAN